MASPRPPPSVASTSRTKPLQQPLAKRLLFPSLPPDAPYPPLSSFSSSDVDTEIYDFIALALRAYVSPWWSKISRYDKEFIPEVNRTLIHVIHELDTRLHGLDLSILLLRDVPVILTQHYRDYRNAVSKLSTSYANGGSYSLPHLFHQLQPHMAVSPNGLLNDDYFRHIVDQILRLTLPPEDYAAEAERFIVREVILKLILVDILPRISQPWFIQLVLLDLFGAERDQYVPSNATSVAPASTTNPSQSLLILLLSTVQKLSGGSLAIVHAYKQAVSTIKSVNQLPPLLPRPRQSHVDSHPGIPVPPRKGGELSSRLSPESSHPTSQSPATALPLLILFSEAFNTAERLASQIITTLLYLLVALCTSFLDRLAPHLLMTSLSPTFILNLTRTAKHNLFPNGYPIPPMEDPTPEEQAIIYGKLIAVRPTGVLAYVLPFILGSDPTATLDAAIEPLSDHTCNLHLAVIVLERMLVGLFPELVDRGRASSQ